MLKKRITFIFCCLFIYNCQSDNFISKSLSYPWKCELNINSSFSFGYMPVSEKGTSYICGYFIGGCIDEKCYSGQNMTIYAINDDCEVKWKYDTKREDICESTCLAIGKNSDIYFTNGGITKPKNLYSLSAKGLLNWKIDLGMESCEQIAIGSDGTIYVQLENILYAIDPNKEIKWSIPINRLEGPLIGPGDNIYVTQIDSNQKFHLSSLSEEGNINWDYDFGTDEIPDRAVIGPSGNIYTISIAKAEIIDDPDPMAIWYEGFPSNAAKGEVYLSSFDQNGNLNWRVKLGEGGYWLNSSGTLSGLLVGEDEVIYTSYIHWGLKAINSKDGSIKWDYEEKEPHNNNASLIDSQGNIYFLGDLKGKIFDRNGSEISSILPPNNYLMGQGSVLNGDYFYNIGGDFIIYQVLGSGYSKSGWSMRFHDPQNTNRWNGGS